MEFTKNIEFTNCPTVNQELTVNYNGIFSNSSELTIVYGFGEAWHHTTEALMTKTSTGFSAKITILDFDTFNFCFRNSNNEWDNNTNCNYISPILPAPAPIPTSPKFDIDALIEEILEPITMKPMVEIEDVAPVEISTEPIDLSLEIRNLLSEIAAQPPTQNLVEYSTLDEILSGTVIDETPVELFEIEEEIFPETATEVIPEKTALINIEDPFIISPRKLGRFYSFQKRIKLSFYKLFHKLPKLLFGSQE